MRDKYPHNAISTLGRIVWYPADIFVYITWSSIIRIYSQLYSCLPVFRQFSGSIKIHIRKYNFSKHFFYAWTNVIKISSGSEVETKKPTNRCNNSKCTQKTHHKWTQQGEEEADQITVICNCSSVCSKFPIVSTWFAFSKH